MEFFINTPDKDPNGRAVIFVCFKFFLFLLTFYKIIHSKTN